jgi:hypothetical protein
MVIDTTHPLAKYAKVRDADGNLIKTAYWADTDAGLVRRYQTNDAGKVIAQQDPETLSWGLASELLSGRFTVTFEGVPLWRKLRFRFLGR